MNLSASDSRDEETKMVAHFMARQFIESIEMNPDKEHYIQLRPPRDFRKPHPSNIDWERCNAFVNMSWNSNNWLTGLKITFGSFITVRNEEGEPMHQKIAPCAEQIVCELQSLHNIRKSHPFPRGCLNSSEIKGLLDTLINRDGLIYVDKIF